MVTARVRCCRSGEGLKGTGLGEGRRLCQRFGIQEGCSEAKPLRGEGGSSATTGSDTASRPNNATNLARYPAAGWRTCLGTACSTLMPGKGSSAPRVGITVHQLQPELSGHAEAEDFRQRGRKQWFPFIPFISGVTSPKISEHICSGWTEINNPTCQKNRTTGPLFGSTAENPNGVLLEGSPFTEKADLENFFSQEGSNRSKNSKKARFLTMSEKLTQKCLEN